MGQGGGGRFFLQMYNKLISRLIKYNEEEGDYSKVLSFCMVQYHAFTWPMGPKYATEVKYWKQ